MFRPFSVDANFSRPKSPNKSKNFYTNWRPIAVTSIVARVMERVVASRLIKELEIVHVPRNI